MHEEVEDKTAGDDRCDLSRHVYTYGVHEQEVLGVCFESHLVDHTARHGECGDTCRADHGVHLFLEEEIEELCEEDAACGIEDKSEETKAENEKSLGLEELFGNHLGGDSDSEEDGDKVCKDLLCGFGERIENAALTDKVTEHKEAHERYRGGCYHACYDGYDNGEEYSCGLGNVFGFVGHADHALVLCCQQLDDRGLDHGHKCHIGVCRHHDSGEIFGAQLLSDDDGCRAVSRGNGCDGCRVVYVEEHGAEAEGKEDTELRRRTEEHELRV